MDVAAGVAAFQEPAARGNGELLATGAAAHFCKSPTLARHAMCSPLVPSAALAHWPANCTLRNRFPAAERPTGKITFFKAELASGTSELSASGCANNRDISF
jgi:hypothetical protein